MEGNDMNKKQTADVELQATADGIRKEYGRGTPGSFMVGHQKVGGRKPGSPNKRTKLALEICQELNFHPAAFLATIALTGLMPNPDGTTTPVTTEDRLKASLGLAPFVMPRLQATQLTGKDDGAIAAVNFDFTQLLQNPEAVEAMQKLALAMAAVPDEPAPSISGPDEATRLLPAGDDSV
jgi:hypothetical protein